MLPYKQGLFISKQILDKINKQLQHEPELDDVARGNAVVEGYVNGREHGYCIKIFSILDTYCISFGSCRGSDQIVVYEGQNFGPQGNTPDEKAYKNAKYFEDHQRIQAADYILSLIRIQLAHDKHFEHRG